MTAQSIARGTQDDGGAGPEPVQETLFQALVRPSERRVFTHDGCGGWVLFDLQGGYCLACDARRLRSAHYHKPQTAA